MPPKRWQQIERLFHRCLELEPADRPALLSEACAGDEELRSEVGSLLTAHEQSDTFLEGAPGWTLQEALLERLLDFTGRTVGSYKVVREIGRGGMGAVFLASRDDGEFEHQVALKVLHPGMVTPGLLRRFRNERQILADIDHPNVAHLIDGGTTSEGLPYFFMEYVEGEPIDRYCDARCLTIRQRLNLFVDVCSAVECSHGYGIVHRDIKPGNVLVTADGQPKLLDFGIAKLLSPGALHAQREPTQFEARLMTPAFASPEQMRGQEVTPASDVYSLGVLLYMFLAGRPPYRLPEAELAEVTRIVCETRPDFPSRFITSPSPEGTEQGTIRPGELDGADPETVARARGVTPGKLRRQLAGDLDRIVLMAMRKEPERRYPSATALAEDIRHHLDACPCAVRRAGTERCSFSLTRGSV